MVALRASAVPLPGKKILQHKVGFVNPYRHKGMTKPTLCCLNLSPGELRYFHRASCRYTLLIS